MNNIVIGIPTFKRPIQLNKLLVSIFALQIDNSLIKKVDIVLIDNDKERSAEPVVKRLESKSIGRFRLHYHNYPKKGLTLVRNEILKKALELKPDFIACIDDDEYPSPKWLNELVSHIIVNNADLVVGGIVPVFEMDVSKSLSKWFFLAKPTNPSKIGYHCSTGNLILRAKFLEDHNLRFDIRFNKTGAEDTFFGVQAEKKGGICLNTEKAIIFENIPQKRGTLKWLLKRKYRTALTYITILKIEKKHGLLTKKILTSFIYLFAGILALVLAPFRFNNRYIGLVKIAESLGGFAGIFNINYEEYS